MLARAVKAKLKGLDPRLAVGKIVIPGGLFGIVLSLQRQKQRSKGVSTLLYLKDFGRTMEKKLLTSDLDRNYIQELLTLQDLKNNGMSRGEVIGLI